MNNRPKAKLSAAQGVVLALVILNLCLTLWLICAVAGGNGQEEHGAGTRYTLYIGTNDKDTYTQLIPLEEAKQIVNGICAKHVEGYTVQEANGGWVDEKGVLTQEETLVYTFVDVQEETLEVLMDEVLQALNQSSILVERQEIAYRYYAGQ